MLKHLKQQVLEANLNLVKFNLVTLTWGNVSGISREDELIVIKPSGVEYDKLRVKDMVVVDMTGKVIEGALRPSSDLQTHIELYKAFKTIGGIAHSHSQYATAFAQAGKEIPCLGTTHADTFYGNIPVTRILTKKEVEKAYELNTGKVIIERFKKIDSESMPAVLVAGHAPFTWGKNALSAVENNLILENVAKMALLTLNLNEKIKVLPGYILEKHFERKHGKNAYYGQTSKRK